MIRFRKLYNRVGEMDYGASIDAIIIFEKRPMMYHTKMLSQHEAIEKGYQVETIVTEHRYFLRIDLWFVVFEFTWRR